MTSILLIAGETSGDQLGGWLMQALKKAEPGIQFSGIGGANMQAQGLDSLFPMQELSLFGFWEVFPHALNIKRRIQQTVEFIEQTKPDTVVTIDAPGFTLRVVKALRERNIYRPRFVHYVAPTVWAYKPNRARLTAERVDDLLVLLPFEPPYFEKENLRTHFVGHEIAWWWKQTGDGDRFRAQHEIPTDAPLLAVFPGSRKGELKRLLPVFEETIEKLRANIPNLQVVMQVPPAFVGTVNAATSHWATPPWVISSATDKKDMFAAATAALAKSGTIGLECALAGLPSIITYRTNAFTAALLRRILKTKFVGLANILLGREVVPELLQEHCNPQEISAALLPLLSNTPQRAAQIEAIEALPTLLGADDAQSPSDKAAAIILNRS